MAANSIAARQYPLPQRILCVLMLWALISGSTAQERDVSEVSATDVPVESDEDELSLEEQEALLRRAREVEARTASIAEIQFELGIYDPSLIEAYADLAQVYIESEDWASAIEAFNSALQISRIANGLESDSQLSVIDSLIASYGPIEDWRAIDDLQYLALHIGKRLYQLEDAEYLESLNQFGDWKLRVLKENLLSLSGSGMIGVAAELSDFYESAVEAAILNRLPASQELLQLNYGKAMTDVEMARAIARTPYTAFQGTANPYVNETRCGNTSNAQGQIVRRCYRVQVENPRYRRSQADAKQLALRRRNQAIADSIVRLRGLLVSVDLPREERDELEAQIRQMEAEIVNLGRSVGRPRLF